MDDARENIIGNVTLFDATIQKSTGSDRQVIRECSTENERVVALKELFDIDLTDEEKEGMSTNLRLS